MALSVSRRWLLWVDEQHVTRGEVTLYLIG